MTRRAAKMVVLSLDGGETPSGIRRYRCLVWCVPEADGGYSVLVPDLPGCVSQGDTIPECLTRIVEALTGVAETYLEKYGRVPWQHSEESAPIGTDEKWVTFDAKGDALP